MAMRYNKKEHVRSFCVGDKVSVRIPRIDRANTDLSRLSCLMVEVLGKTSCHYRLRYVCMHESLQQIYSLCNNVCYPASELEEYSGALNYSLDGWKELLSISLTGCSETVTMECICCEFL